MACFRLQHTPETSPIQHAQPNWARVKLAGPVSDAGIRHRLLASLMVVPDHFRLHLAPRQRPPFPEVRSLANAERLYIDDSGMLTLVRT